MTCGVAGKVGESNALSRAMATDMIVVICTFRSTLGVASSAVVQEKQG